MCFFEGRPRPVPGKFCLYCRTLVHVMERSESSNDSPPSNIVPHILRTLNNGQMGLVGANSFMLDLDYFENEMKAEI
jgi:hypothetical protein